MGFERRPRSVGGGGWGWGLAPRSEGVGSAVGRWLLGVSILWAVWVEGRQVAEAGTCSGGNGPGWVEFPLLRRELKLAP